MSKLLLVLPLVLISAYVLVPSLQQVGFMNLEIQLTFSYTGAYNSQISITYQWSGNSAENRSGELIFEWEKETSAGKYGIMANDVDRTIVSYFDVLLAEGNRLSINSMGEWAIQTALRTLEGFSLFVEFEGTNKSISECRIQAELDLLPEELKSQLAQLGIKELRLSAKLTISINPEFWQRLVHWIISLIKEIVEAFKQFVDAIQFPFE